MKAKKKVPKLFRKSITKKRLEKKILRRIHLQSEKDFLLSKLQTEESGNYILKIDDLQKQDLKRLKKLAASIKKNRGVLAGWKAAILLILIAGVLAFNYLYKNALVEEAAEASLEKVFGARVDLEGASLSLLEGRLSFEHLAIADRLDPMQNLTEIGNSNLSIDMDNLLTGNFIIEEAAAREIRFHTPRDSSGALPESDAAESGDSEESGTEAGGESASLGGEIKELGLEIGRESAETYIRSVEDSLQSPELIEGANERYRSSRAEWQKKTESLETQFSSVKSESQQVLDTDVASIDNVEEARSYLGKLNSLKKSVQSSKTASQEAYQQFQEDTEYLRTSRRAIDEAIDEDLDFVKSKIDTFGTEGMQIIAATARPLIQEKLGRIYDYGSRIARVYKKIKAQSEDKESKFSDSGRQGTLVRFPKREYPAFLLKHFEISAGSEGSRTFSQFQINDLTGNQELWGKPTTVRFATIPRSPSLSSQLTIDTRSDSSAFLEGNLDLSDYPVDLSSGLSSLSIESFRSASDTQLELRFQNDLSGSGTALINLRDMKVDFEESSSILGSAMQEIFSEIDTAELSADFDFADGTLTGLRISTDLDDMLAGRIGDYAEQKSKEAAAEIEQAFYEHIEEELAANEQLDQNLQSEGKDIAQQIREAESTEALIQSQEEKVRALIQQKIDEQSSELKDKAGESLKDLGDKINLPSF